MRKEYCRRSELAGTEGVSVSGGGADVEDLDAGSAFMRNERRDRHGGLSGRIVGFCAEGICRGKYEINAAGCIMAPGLHEGVLKRMRKGL